jgi:hypothetical protein
MTAVNDEGGNINVARDVDGSEDTIPRTMQKYQQRGEGWMLVVDDNCMSFQSSPLLFPLHSSLWKYALGPPPLYVLDRGFGADF